jgi:Pentapeptide repeats (8 copies)
MYRTSIIIGGLFAVFLLIPSDGRAFNEIDQIGSNNFKPMRGCSNCHLRRRNSAGGIRWIGAVLPKAELRGADLKNADMRGADMRETDLRQADLRNADFSGANLRNADLRGADLSGAKLYKANLRGAKLCRTTMPDGSLDNSGCERELKSVGKPPPSPENAPAPVATVVAPIVAPARNLTANPPPQKGFTFLGFRITLP